MLPTQYQGYVTVGTSDTVEYVRPHPTLPETWILSRIWTPRDGPLSLRIRSGPYTIDLQTHTCTCPAFLKGAGRTPVHRRSCKHLDRHTWYVPEHEVDLVAFEPRDRAPVPFQLFGNNVPKHFYLPSKIWLWSIKHDGIRIGIHGSSGYGTTQNGMTVDLRTLLPPTWTTIARQACVTLGVDALVFDAELVPVGVRSPLRPGHNVVMDLLNQNSLNGLRLRIFDVLVPEQSFQVRYGLLQGLVELQEMLVVQHVMETCTRSDLLTILSGVLADGQEGLMIRRNDQRYASGKRTGTHAFKLKSVDASL